MKPSTKNIVIGLGFWALVLTLWIPSWYNEPVLPNKTKNNNTSKVKFEELKIRTKENKAQTSNKKSANDKKTKATKKVTNNNNTKKNTNEITKQQKSNVYNTKATAVIDRSLWKIRVVCYTSFNLLSEFERKIKEDFKQYKIIQNIYPSGERGENEKNYYCVSIGPIIAKNKAEQLQTKINKKYFVETQLSKF